MTLENWTTLNKELNRICERINHSYYIYTKGKNKEAREKGKHEIEEMIELSMYWINKYPSSKAIICDKNRSPQEIQEIWDEFKSIRWFRTEIKKFLQEVKIKIEQFDIC